MSNRDSIKVVCRIRPENAIEKQGAYQKCVEHDSTQIQVTVSPRCLTLQVTADSKVSDMNGSHKFSFDRVFGSEAT
jgi:hypothetical protein